MVAVADAMNDDGNNDGDGADVDDRDDVFSPRRSTRVLWPTWELRSGLQYVDTEDSEQHALRSAWGAFQTAQSMHHQALFILNWVYECAQKRELEENWLPNEGGETD